MLAHSHHDSKPGGMSVEPLIRDLDALSNIEKTHQDVLELERVSQEKIQAVNDVIDGMYKERVVQVVERIECMIKLGIFPHAKQRVWFRKY